MKLILYLHANVFSQHLNCLRGSPLNSRVLIQYTNEAIILISLGNDMGIFLELFCSLKKKYSTVYRTSLSSEFILKSSKASKDYEAFYPHEKTNAHLTLNKFW